MAIPKMAGGHITRGIQRRLAWPLQKDDTLFQSGRPTGLNIYFNLFILISLGPVLFTGVSASVLSSVSARLWCEPEIIFSKSASGARVVA